MKLQRGRKNKREEKGMKREIGRTREEADKTEIVMRLPNRDRDR